MKSSSFSLAIVMTPLWVNTDLTTEADPSRLRLHLRRCRRHILVLDFWPDTPQPLFIFAKSKFRFRGFAAEADKLGPVASSLPRKSLCQRMMSWRDLMPLCRIRLWRAACRLCTSQKMSWIEMLHYSKWRPWIGGSRLSYVPRAGDLPMRAGEDYLFI